MKNIAKSRKTIGLNPVCRLSLLVALLVAHPFFVSGATWEMSDGRKAEGTLIAFDYVEKAIEIAPDREGTQTRLFTIDLSTANRFEILVSPFFLEAYPSDAKGIARKSALLGYLVVFSFLALAVGFVLTALIVAKAWQPFRLTIAFVGAWVVSALLMASYVLFAYRYGNTLAVGAVGIVVSLVFASLWISAFLRCGFLRAVLISIGHVAAGIAVMLVAVILFVQLVDPDTQHRWLEQAFFRPIGLV